MEKKIFQAPQIIVALDLDSLTAFRELTHKLDPKRCRLKIGKSLFTRFGPALIEEVMKQGFDVFLDLKFHDIPQQVALACRAVADLNVWMLTLHACGGEHMLEAAVDAFSHYRNPPLLVAVTVLTSLSAKDLHHLGIQDSLQEQVLRLAKLALNSGVDGLVCSPQEVSLIRQHFTQNYCIVTPGIRPKGSKADDQKRTLSPYEALQAGSNYLVIGRPITLAKDPAQILTDLELDMHLNRM